MCSGSSPKPTPPPPPPPPAPQAPLKIGGNNVDDMDAALARKKTGKNKLTVPMDTVGGATGSALTIPK